MPVKSYPSIPPPPHPAEELLAIYGYWEGSQLSSELWPPEATYDLASAHMQAALRGVFKL